MILIMKIENKEKLFSIGSIVQYRNTGTIGKISQFKKIDNELFVQLDSTGLYYNINYLDLIEKDISLKKENDKNNVIEDIKEKIYIKEEAISGYSSENIDGPGGAG